MLKEQIVVSPAAISSWHNTSTEIKDLLWYETPLGLYHFYNRFKFCNPSIRNIQHV